MTGWLMVNPSTDAVVRMEQVSLAFGAKVVFNDVTLSVPQGKITVVAGPSGTGKTTLLKLITGQQRPDSGRVLFQDQPIAIDDTTTLYNQRRHMGMLFQTGALFPHLSVFENVAFPVREHLDLPEELLELLIYLKLESVGLRGAADLMPETLSGGMARRVALARATVLDPALILYDEPLTGQDPVSVGVLLRLIKHMQVTYGSSALIVSHQLHHMAAIADHMIVLAEGRVLGSGHPDALMHSDEPTITQFMRGDSDGLIPFHYPAEPIEQLLSRS